jgi:hypothetical protein
MASKSTKKVESVPPPAPEAEPTEALAAEVVGSSELSTEVVDEWDYGEDANKGFKNLSRDEFSIPFYGLLQSNSEIVKQNKIEGARGGMFLNTIPPVIFKIWVGLARHVAGPNEHGPEPGKWELTRPERRGFSMLKRRG